MFFIKAAFWLTLVVALIPVNPADLSNDERNVSTLETIGVAKSFFQDVSGFCERNSQSCASGSIVLSQMGLKAREGARIVYSYFDTHVVDENAQTKMFETDKVNVGSISKSK